MHNILDVEHAALKNASDPAAPSATILLDFKAAFPSLSREFIFEACRKVGLHDNVIAAMRSLYADNIHYLKLCGRVRQAFTIVSGVRQGCPLSATVFVIATDAVVRYVTSRLRPRDMLRAYADDIALTIADIWQTLQGLSVAFNTVANGARLELNHKKCVLLPGWKYSLRALRTLLREDVPHWANFDIRDAAIYLGIGVGPKGLELSWQSPLAKFIQRANYVRGLGLGLAAQAMLYNVLAISVLQYVAQIRPLPRIALQIENELLPKLIPARHNWISVAALTRMDHILPFKTAPKSMAHFCFASATRSAMQLSKDGYGQCWPEIGQILNTNGYLTHRHPRWHSANPDKFVHDSLTLRDVAAGSCDLDSGSSRQTMLYLHALQSTHCTRAPGLYEYVHMKANINGNLSFYPQEYLLRRFKNLFNDADAIRATQATLVTAHVLHGQPQRTLSVVLKLWLNAWPLRSCVFEHSRCLFCYEWLSTPSVKHLASCSFVRKIHEKLLMRPPRSLRCLLLLSNDPEDIIKRRAHVLHTLHNTLCRIRRLENYDAMHLFWLAHRRKAPAP